MYRILSLFAGIGGFDLGLERTGGFETVAFCEIEPFAVRVLNKHWPEVPVYGDVRELTGERLRADGIVPDVIVGGFPCQDISLAGKGAGIDGERSGLWADYSRLIGEIRPRFVIVENVAALLGRGMERVLGDLAALRYDAEWHCIPASALGASHRRDRLWVVAYPESIGAAERQERAGGAITDGCCPAPACEVLANANDSDGETFLSKVADTQGWPRQIIRQIGPRSDGGTWWTPEPDVGRVAHGVPNRAHRLRALGNAVVPQIPELIGHAILASEAA